jgi:hypothetical protein
MSIGARFVAFDGLRLEALVSEPSNLSAYFDTPADCGGPNAFQTVEQAWDVVRTLLPEAIGDNLLEDADVGEFGCFYMAADEVCESARILFQRDMAVLVRQFVDEPQDYEELYWVQHWRDEPPTLLQIFNDVEQFFAAAALRRDAVMFCVQ